MVSWGQFFSGYWASYRLPEDSIFLEMAAPPGWRKDLVMSVGGMSLFFVYPLRPGKDVKSSDRIL